jgi:hypothetical protein
LSLQFDEQEVSIYLLVGFLSFFSVVPIQLITDDYAYTTIYPAIYCFVALIISVALEYRLMLGHIAWTQNYGSLRPQAIKLIETTRRQTEYNQKVRIEHNKTPNQDAKTVSKRSKCQNIGGKIDTS